jgi:hypothetical protein
MKYNITGKQGDTGPLKTLFLHRIIHILKPRPATTPGLQLCLEPNQRLPFKPTAYIILDRERREEMSIKQTA